jgi:O-antigen/teichoic acid export membrane protein
MNLSLINISKKTKIDIISIFTSSTFSQFIQFIFLVVLSRSVSIDDLGVYQYFMSLAGFMVFSSFPGLSDMIRQEIARNNPNLNFSSQIIQFLTSCIGSILIFAYSIFVNDPIIKNCLYILSFFFPLSYGLSLWKDIMIGHGEMAKFAKYQAVNQVIIYGTSIIYLLYFNEDIMNLLILHFVCRTLVNVSMTILVRNHFAPKWVFNKQNLYYSISNTLSIFINNIGVFIDKILLFNFVSPTNLAIYAISEKLPEAIKSQIQGLRKILLPKFAREKHYTKTLDKKIKKISCLIAVVIIIIALVIVPTFIKFMFGDQYAKSILICQCLMGTMIIGQITQFKASYILSHLDASSVRLYTLGANFVKIVASCLFVPVYGVWGAVLSVFLYRISLNVLVNIAMRKHAEK